jgi:vacuolar protein sorting-associated protein IST1
MWDGCNSKTLLRLAMARIKLFRNKRDVQVKQLRKEISQLLASGQEPSARIRVS